MNYKDEILKRLILKYNKNTSGLIKMKPEAICPNYLTRGYIQEYQDFNAAAKSLTQSDFVDITLNKKTNDIKSVILNKEKVAEISEVIGIKLIINFNEDLIGILNQYKNSKHEILSKYCSNQLLKAINGEKVQLCLLNDKPEFNLVDFNNILLGCNEILSLNDDILMRDLSVRIYNDSKLLEKYVVKILKIIAPGDGKDKTKKEILEILEELHVLKNPTFVMIKGNVLVRFLNGDKITCKNYNSAVSFGGDYVDKISSVFVSKVLTIENLTTFNGYVPEENQLVVYLEGYSNNVTVNFLKKIKETDISANIEFKHFGDIDAHGFRILRNLCERTNIHFIPYRMDIDTIKQYDIFTKPLTKCNEDLLPNMLADSYYDEAQKDVFRYMLDNFCTLEQEALAR